MRFEVQETKLYPSENSMVYLNPSDMNNFKILKGDILTLFGNKQTLAIAREDESVPKGKIQMNKVIKKNLNVNIGDTIEIKLLEVNFGKQIKVLPVEETVQQFKEIFPELIQTYFKDSFRPVSKGDFFTVPTGFSGKVVEFQIIEIQGAKACVVSSETLIDLKGDPVQGRVKINQLKEKITIGGYHEQTSELSCIMKSNMKEEEQLKETILLVGPDGCGKKHVIQVLSAKQNYNLFIMKVSEIITSVKEQFISGAKDLQNLFFRSYSLDWEIISSKTNLYQIILECESKE
jgi:AAA+ superfamily predicted ATPase